jgi:hypothetical protein
MGDVEQKWPDVDVPLCAGGLPFKLAEQFAWVSMVLFSVLRCLGDPVDEVDAVLRRGRQRAQVGWRNPFSRVPRV